MIKGIIPIGGRGTRMRPVTFTANKHFIPIANKPLIFYPIETLVKAGIKNIAITYNPGQLEYAKPLLGDGSKWGIKLEYVLQPNPIGLANIIQVCEKWLDGSAFVLHLGDNIFVDGIDELVDSFEKNKPDGMIAMLHHPENSRMGVPYFDTNHQLIKYVEKPKKPPHDFAIPGIYFGNNNFFKSFYGKDKILPSARGEYEIPSPFQWLIDHKYKVNVVEYKGKWLDPGKFNDWLETNEFLLDHLIKTDIQSQPDKKTVIKGKVKVGKNCIIKNSVLTGPLTIADNTVIENSFVGPATSIYHHCQLINCTIENSVLMDNIIIKNVKKPINNSIVGPNCEITGNPDKTHTSFFVGEMGKIQI